MTRSIGSHPFTCCMSPKESTGCGIRALTLLNRAARHFLGRYRDRWGGLPSPWSCFLQRPPSPSQHCGAEGPIPYSVPGARPLPGYGPPKSLPNPFNSLAISLTENSEHNKFNTLESLITVITGLAARERSRRPPALSPR